MTCHAVQQGQESVSQYLGVRSRGFLFWTHYQLNSSHNWSVNRSCWFEFSGTWSHHMHVIGHTAVDILSAAFIAAWHQRNAVARMGAYQVVVLSASFCCVRDWLEVIRSNQQDQLARAELFIFSNCRDPHTVVVSIKKGNNYNCSVHFCRGKQRLLLLTMACNSSISMYETLWFVYQ